ncbi:putative hydrolase of the HAD superfamily [Flexibacter flexilis DSM 6793]|uniref:Putative hydrolase of the HAD superfamily n=1 Tax=Flexibacter flexilis DSM 6793 TaxID=927664 RepID=A0A1I1H7A9_9BACT|nr:HAD family hydrolase [Flexibacter flexilis]SFC17313.1 putative hydrolase of the HAD superfamily [Flexibacter flexilis DSM 6793]
MRHHHLAAFLSINPQEFAGILLDLDDTLYSYQPAHEAGQAAMLAFLAKQTGASEIEVSQQLSASRQLVHHRLHGQAASHSRLLYAQGAIEKLTGKSNPALVLEAEEIYWATFLDTAIVFEEAIVFLEKCKQSGVPVCLITDLTAQIQLRKLTHWNLAPYISFVVSSEEAGVEKPHPHIFELALAKLKILPQQALMIGDSEKKDIAGAKVLGISTQQI